MVDLACNFELDRPMCTDDSWADVTSWSAIAPTNLKAIIHYEVVLMIVFDVLHTLMYQGYTCMAKQK